VIRTLTDGGQQPSEIARAVASFLDAAQHTLDVSQYDFNLGAETAAIVGDAFRRAAARGVKTRFTYNVDHGCPIPVPPPPEPDVQLIASLPVDGKPIAGIPDLMHHKYVIRDGADVWTGSLNWTDDSWTREENVIVIVPSTGVAIRYQDDFAQLWKKRKVSASGKVATNPIQVGDAMVRTWFSPKRGEKMAHRIADAIGGAERRVRVASPVITSAPILGTLAEVAADGKVDLAGVVDSTQIYEVLGQWRLNGNVTWKAPSLKFLLERATFSGKRSTPYAPGSVHDYMHAKVTVADDTVFIGSFNLSHSGETNAENVLEIEDPALAERMAAFVDSIRAKYPGLTLD